MTDDISLKQVLDDFEALLADTGKYIRSLGKRAYNAAKSVANKKSAPPAPADTAPKTDERQTTAEPATPTTTSP